MPIQYKKITDCATFPPPPPPNPPPPPPPPPPPFSGYSEDAFTDTAGTLLISHTMNVGTGWVTGTTASVWTISSSGTVQTSGTPTFSIERVWTDTPSHADCQGYFYFKPQLIGPNTVGIMFRVNDELNYYLGFVDIAAKLLEIYKCVAGVFGSPLASFPISGTFNASDIYELHFACVGSALSINIFGPGLILIPWLATTDSTYLTQARFGMWTAHPGVVTFHYWQTSPYP